MRALTHRERGANPVPDAAFVFTGITGGVLVWAFFGTGWGAPGVVAGVAAFVLAATVLTTAQGIYPGERGCLPLALLPVVMIGGAFGARAVAASAGLSPAGTQWLTVGCIFLPAFLVMGAVKLLGRG